MSEATRDILDEEAECDMTPMIDCVFLLIIFFLCIDFRVLEAKVLAYLPKDVGAHSTNVEPQEKLNLKIICTKKGSRHLRKKLTAKEVEAGRIDTYFVKNHEVRYDLSSLSFDNPKDLLKELKRIASDPSKRVPDTDKPGKTKLMGVVIEPYPDTVYGDVAKVLDVLGEAEFNDVSFGGGLKNPEKKK